MRSWRGSRVAWCGFGAAVFVALAFSQAWFVNEHFVWPLLPGNWVTEFLRGTVGIKGAPAPFAALLFLANIAFWTAVFYGATTLVGLLIKRLTKSTSPRSLL